MQRSERVESLVSRMRVGAFALIGLLTFGLDATAATKTEVMRMISEEAARNGRVPASLALAVARIESNFNDQAVSPAGARGVMQIMPSTAMGEFGVHKDQLFDPQLNVRLGIAYLERLYNQYGQDWGLALSHYNGGSLRSVGGRHVAHSYTRQYVADVERWNRTYSNNGSAIAVANRQNPEPVVTRIAWKTEEPCRELGHTGPDRGATPVTGASAQRLDTFSANLAQATAELGARFRESLRDRGDLWWDRGHDVDAFEQKRDEPTFSTSTGRGRFL